MKRLLKLFAGFKGLSFSNVCPLQAVGYISMTWAPQDINKTVASPSNMHDDDAKVKKRRSFRQCLLLFETQNKKINDVERAFSFCFSNPDIDTPRAIFWKVDPASVSFFPWKAQNVRASRGLRPLSGSPGDL